MVFTANTAISALDASYDGNDIVISNCTVTMDGAHSFNSVLVGAGGVLTHSFWPAGAAAPVVNVTNEVQTLDAYFPATLLNTNVIGLVTVTDTNTLVTYSNGVDYIQTNLPDGTTQIYATTNSAIPGYAVVYVSYAWSYSFNPGLNLTITNDLTVAGGGSINANGAGYGAGLGPGHGSSSGGTYFDGSGGGHGGNGGISSSNVMGGGCYDLLYQPTALGSGGGASYAGNGGNGGGLIQITAGGNVNIDGMVSANGADATNSRAGGGAGGSIWITATNVNGAGIITANGGAGEPGHGGGGGGGRISIVCGTNNFSGSITAYGGTGFKTGGAGTIYTQTGGQTSQLLVDNGGRAGANSLVSLPTTADVVISGGGSVLLNGAFNPNNLTIATNSTLTTLLPAGVFYLTVNNLVIQAGGILTLDSLGYGEGGGGAPGTVYTGNSLYPGGGGGHGGYGGAGFPTNATGGATYDNQTAPSSLGSGGGGYASSFGGAGGGALHLTVNGNLQVDGVISANGGNGSGTGGGGGSGGSIYIQGYTNIAGTGRITANGGNGVAGVGGGGGGGRIYISAGNNQFTGTLSAYGGGGASYGGAGTIYTQFGSPQQLLVDNGGHAGAATVVQSAFSANLVVQNGGAATANTGVTFASLLVASNAWLTTYSPGSSEAFTISGNATFQAGGGFMANASGAYGPYGTGGSSTFYPYGGGGGGHGGVGGNSFSNSAAGGVNTMDVVSAPSYYNNGGNGGGYLSYSIGGSGGGYVRMTVNGTLQLDGAITANGGNGSGNGGGGGSGGGIYLTAGTFTGHGSVSANGGYGANAYGGGGGGGMIAIYFNNISFDGPITAYGGGGANWGGAGTIYLKPNAAPRAQLIVDNASHVGATTAGYLAGSLVDLTLRNGGNMYVSSSASYGNLVIASNAWLVASNFSGSSVAINAINVTVQAGGSLNADLAGYVQNGGTGRGYYYSFISPNIYPCSGAGHGGYGANCFSNVAPGGIVYDAYSSPNVAGSGGGGYAPYSSYGGNGGGVIQMALSGNLQVDGTLSANGGNGSGNGGGGGSGGSLNLSCSGLLGSGTISVNGGAGAAGLGGGGGGGMIAASFTSNLFTGVLSAYGGSGAYYGGAGTIYLRTNTTGQSTFIVDNGGHRGTNTLVAANTSQNSLILRNGGTAIQSSSSQTYSSLVIGSNSWLLCNLVNYSQGTVNCTVYGNATLQSGGGISADGAGYIQNQGQGHGVSYGNSPWYQSSGAGHGGYGGFALSNAVAGGGTYDSTASGGTSGSGGGGYGGSSLGGSGGGVVNLSVFNGTLQVDGSITANGLNGSGTGGGGGSGGSIYLAARSFAGTGNISANGGNGANTYGGGGGGGRIAIYTTGQSNSFAGAVTAYGGGGYAYGGAGTVYYNGYFTNYPKLVLDNHNNAGTNTTFDLNSMDVIIQGNAVGMLPAYNFSWSLRNLTIHTNGMLTAQPYSGKRSLYANNVIVDAGGALQVDGAGYGSQSGPGSGFASVNVRGGGGHGGYGGGDAINGGAYDSITSPAAAGSGGSSSGFAGPPPYGYGGDGGGALALSASGTLTVNGRLSANGGNGGYNSGGGSGGSLYLSYINQLVGNGVISANGGSFGSGAAGGGGGGRIAMICHSNAFTGLISAYGGNGQYPGGAGTIYTYVAGNQTLLVDNGGLAGTNTPLSSSFTMPGAPFNLNISGAATVVPLTPLPLVSNLTLAAGSTLTVPAAQSNLFIAVQNNANLAGSVIVDNLGYAQTNGPGTGSTISDNGSGGGYGGVGGNSSSGAPGGITYGSATQPTDFGSGGGYGVATTTGGSEGGGALRISVGGTLNVDGNISANGDYGWQDNSGGGSGGSVWINATTLTGAGNISALGGSGAPAGGGGGGGGRIAIYAPTNLFTGITNANGGSGANAGQPGTVFYSSTFGNFEIVSQSPTGLVNNVVSAVDLTFNEAVDPASVLATAFSLMSPAGPVSGIGASASGATMVHVTFPVQNLPGDYTLQVAPDIANILGVPLTQAYTNSFTITLPTISGTVGDTNGAPVAGVNVQPNGGLPATTTDVNGNYSIGVPPGWNGSVTPSFGTFVFVPGTINYTNITASQTNQNYLMVSTIAPTLATSLTGTNLSLVWPAISGVTYQAYSSTNMVDWVPYGNTIPGTNGTQQIVLPVDATVPATFFRIGAAN